MEQPRMSAGEFIELLQMEFISRKMRSLFYEDEKAKVTNAEIAQKKKEKILAVAQRMKDYLTIFDREAILETMFYKKFLNPYGLPNLTYGNNCEMVRWFDKMAFVKRGHWVDYKGESFRVINNDPDKEEITILHNKKKLSAPYIYFTLTTLEEFDCDNLLR